MAEEISSWRFLLAGCSRRQQSTARCGTFHAQLRSRCQGVDCARAVRQDVPLSPALLEFHHRVLWRRRGSRERVVCLLQQRRPTLSVANDDHIINIVCSNHESDYYYLYTYIETANSFYKMLKKCSRLAKYIVISCELEVWIFFILKVVYDWGVMPAALVLIILISGSWA